MFVLSFILSALGAYVALEATSKIRNEDGGLRVGYVLVGALALGGVTIWGMQFLGMAAQRYPFAVGYEFGLTFLTFVISVVVAGVALWYVGKSAFSAKTCIVSGCATGAVMAGVNYLGMDAVHTQGVLSWSVLGVGASILIAAVAATVSLWLAFNVESEAQRRTASVVMALSVGGSHYIGVLACTFIYVPKPGDSGLILEGAYLPYVVFALCLAMLGVMKLQLARAARVYQKRLEVRMNELLESRDTTHPG
ncbi:MHYT domain-containing protein [Pigmentiphaga aceris]|nr:MHYT domain-containing protein [Pigmentiphaga aceris]